MDNRTASTTPTTDEEALKRLGEMLNGDTHILLARALYSRNRQQGQEIDVAWANALREYIQRIDAILGETDPADD